MNGDGRLIILAFICVVAMIFMPSQSLSGAYEGIDLCIRRVIPALFPFFVCSRILMGSGLPELVGKAIGRPFEWLFGVNRNCSFAFITGLLCGYPIGGKVVADMYAEGICTKGEAQRMLGFCNNSGPLFILGTVGVGFLGSQRAGFILYLAHILSAIGVGIISRLIIPTEKSKAHVTLRACTPIATFHTAIISSIKSMASVCGNIVFFSVIISAITPILGLFRLSPTANGLICGAVEITSGVSQLSIISLPLIGFLLAWSGISIIMQVNAIISTTGLSTITFAITKLIQGVIAYLFTTLLLRHMNIPLNTTPIGMVFIGSAIVVLFAIMIEKLFANRQNKKSCSKMLF
ncbi:MAG: hypothetical protein PHE51_01890 [Eubacteriales bacterium]|nr:hypothetical protein [Eubacteriales bacterium]